MSQKIASTTDSQSALERAANSERSDRHIPIGMNVQLERRRSEAVPDENVTLSEAGFGEQQIDGGTEHSPLRVTQYHNGQLVEPRISQQLADLADAYDWEAIRHRNDELSAKLSDYERTIGQDVKLPSGVVDVVLRHPRGSLLGFWLGKNAAFCKQLLTMDPLKAQTIAIQKAESLNADDVAGWMRHREFRKWREAQR
jgi:hypothetical protein